MGKEMDELKRELKLIRGDINLTRSVLHEMDDALVALYETAKAILDEIRAMRKEGAAIGDGGVLDVGAPFVGNNQEMRGVKK